MYVIVPIMLENELGIGLLTLIFFESEFMKKKSQFPTSRELNENVL